MMTDYADLVALIVKLGDELPPVAGTVEDIGTKKQLLTKYDLYIEERLSQLIRTFPGQHTVFAEELHADFQAAENVWIIDPISHTLNFLRGLPHYAIVCSHMHKGNVVFSAVYDPCMKELFTAQLHMGSFLNGKKMTVDASAISDPVILFGSSLSRCEESVRAFSSLQPLGRIKNFGSYALHYAYVACGRAHGAVSLCKDIFPEFAGKLLLEEAGGEMTTFLGEDFSLHSQYIIASNGRLHDHLVQSLSDIERARS